MKNIFFFLIFLIFIFWFFFYPNHILLSEQLSLFLYSSEFWKQYALQPGGWSTYCGNFIAQFYIIRWTGALFQTLLFAALLFISRRILIKSGLRGISLLIALLPVIWLLFLQFDYRFTPGNALALICPFALTLLYMNMQTAVVRRLLFSLAIVPVYLFSGPVATCSLYAACVIYEIIVAKDKWKYVTPAWLVITFLMPVFWQMVYLTPNDRFFQIGDYPLDKGNLFPKTYNRLEEKKLGMYMAVSHYNWDEALNIGKRLKIPDQQSARLINLSLAMKDELPQKMFSYLQTDEYGLLPYRDNDHFTMLSGSAFYYHIGLLNEAIRWIFDSNIMRKKGIDYHTLIRLAVWNRENGNEQLAEKYFNILNHTLMYRSHEKMPVRKRENTVNQKEFYIGGRDPLADMAWHYDNHPQNKMILDYVLCTLLLKNDLVKFQNVYNRYYPDRQILPQSYQEALLEMANRKMVDVRRFPIDKNNEIRYRSFNDLVVKRNEKDLKKQFGDTWWYYSYQKSK